MHEAPSRAHLASGWPHTPTAFPSTGKPRRYDWIVSNPPVHHGQPDDFRVLITLLRGARRRLKPDGVLWIVAQEQVPVGRLLALHGRFAWVRAQEADGGRFVVWSAGGKRRAYAHVSALLKEASPTPGAEAEGDGDGYGDGDVGVGEKPALLPAPSAAATVKGAPAAPAAAVLSRTARRREGRKRKRDATRPREEGHDAIEE